MSQDGNAKLMLPDRRPRLSVIVPTLNEVANLRPIVTRVDGVVSTIAHEIVIVDDASTDGTAELADTLAATRPNVRVLHRPLVDRGLSAAILTGFEAARGDAVAVIDADLQHEPRVLLRLLDALEDHDLAIGSRYTFRGRTCGWSWLRKIESRAAAALTRAALGLSIHDPLSGCFAMRRTAFEATAPRLRPRGWKLLLDILVMAPDLSVAEVSMTFRSRCRGKTKMNGAVVRSWLTQLRELRRLRRARVPLPIGAVP